MFLVSGGIGGMVASFGERVIGGVDALDKGAEEKLLKEAQKRRARREKRAVQGLYLRNTSETREVTLKTGTLSYPRLKISAPIGKPSLTHWKSQNWRALEEQMQFGLLHGVVAYPHSPPFGVQGNVVIAGHSSAPTPEVRGSPYEDVFASLPESKKGDRIEVRDASGVSHIYEVMETEVIPATEVSILLQDQNAQELTLFTCYPVGTTRERFMVRARLAEGGVVARESTIIKE